MTSSIGIKAIIQISLETIFYAYFPAGSLSSNWPTNVSQIVSESLIALWLLFLRFGWTALSVRNLTYYPLKLKLLLYKNPKQYFKDFFKSLAGFLPVFSQILFNIALIVFLLKVSITIQIQQECYLFFASYIIVRIFT